MGISAFLEPHWKFKAHCVQLGLIVLAIILTGVQLGLPGGIMSRGDIMVITMGVKSLIVIGYQLLSQHTIRFRKWESLKANFILNTFEILFWLVVLILKFQAISRYCAGAACGVSYVVAIIVLVMFLFCLPVAVMSWKDWRHFKQHGTPRDSLPTTAAAPTTYSQAYYAGTPAK